MVSKTVEDATRLSDCDPLEVSRISFTGPQGALVMAREHASGTLRPVGQEIEGFDERTALQLLSTACGLRAKERIDANAVEAAGWQAGSTRVELTTSSKHTFVVTIGRDDRARRLTYVQVSTLPGVFLVPLHVARALRVGPSRLTRTPQQVAIDEEGARAAAAHAAIHERHGDSHPQNARPSSLGTHRAGEAVSPAVLDELRRRARLEPDSKRHNVLGL
ncbi:MAG: hypothetical protein MUC50_21780 [Myxococcota bacterium]|nr:hypothetical protein [Myxococcota bacterium]